MKLMDKLKNALFEEEYVEIEEKPKKEKPKKVKAPEKIKEDKPIKAREKKEEPIAKKIAPVKKEPIIIDEIEEEEPVKTDNSFKFPVMEEEDLKPDNVPSFISDKKYEKKPWGKKKEHKKEYQEYETKDLSYTSYGEEKVEPKFKPSPIISPIYGVLDKNYKKDDVRDKKDREIRLTSPYSRDKISVDDVRNKAFGTLEDTIEDNPLLEQVEPLEEEEKVMDFTNSRKPRVNNVTMGEAEEYFEDLGLEYNKDYVDRGTTNEEEDDALEEVKKEKKPEKAPEPIKEDNDLDDDNLFDLIDSMYDE